MGHHLNFIGLCQLPNLQFSRPFTMQFGADGARWFHARGKSVTSLSISEGQSRNGWLTPNGPAAPGEGSFIGRWHFYED
jgi:hypothetical protein